MFHQCSSWSHLLWLNGGVLSTAWASCSVWMATPGTTALLYGSICATTAVMSYWTVSWGFYKSSETHVGVSAASVSAVPDTDVLSWKTSHQVGIQGKGTHCSWDPSCIQRALACARQAWWPEIIPCINNRFLGDVEFLVGLRPCWKWAVGYLLGLGTLLHSSSLSELHSCLGIENSVVAVGGCQIVTYVTFSLFHNLRRTHLITLLLASVGLSYLSGTFWSWFLKALDRQRR